MKAKMSSLRSVASSSPPKPPPTPQIRSNRKWIPINLTQSELSLPLTFPTGQTFLWKQTGPNQFTGPVGPHLVSLSHRPSSLSFLLHSHSHSSAAAETALLDFLNSQIFLRRISASNPNFAVIAAGVRVLRQSPVECLLQFLCSSNNNIARITSMVAFLSSLGDRLGSVAGLDFHRFPSLDRLAELSERDLRNAGFGYRAKYVVGAVAELRSKPRGGEAWLLSLRKMELRSVMEELCSLPGVGPKVAACVALFSLDQHRAVPVDTHVWKIGTRDLLPELAGTKPTPKLCSRVAEAFVEKYGEYAGWAQAQLFVAELPSQKREKEKNEKKRKSVKRKIVETVIEDDDL